ncbi:MAG: response regulator, partial [Desulfobacterales bacterium]|nr:response regulator [Desulfobacterales bacterium]
EEFDHEMTLRFIVRDTGIGMSEEQVARLFQPFQQADESITRKYGGTGLGLAISKRLVEIMGGELRVESEPGMGTRIAFTARLGKSDREAPIRVETVSRSRVKELLAGRRILLVEDNNINLQVARELIEQIGVRIQTAGNGERAVELAERERFDCILMDLHMPVMDGLTAAREIRKGDAPPDLPIIAMTASAMTGDREQCLAAGMNDHIAKPIRPSRLYETLIRWIRPDVSPGPPLSRGAPPPANGASTAPADAFPPLDGVDVEIGLRNMDGNRALYLMVLKNVHADYRDVAGRIQAELDRKDYGEALRLAHTFKGLAGTMGAKVLEERSFELETAFKNKELDRIPDDMASFAREAERVMTALAPLLSGKNPSRPEAAGGERLKPLLGKLGDLIDEGNSDAADLVAEIRALLTSSRVADDMRDLEFQINDYEFEEARKLFNRITRELSVEI